MLSAENKKLLTLVATIIASIGAMNWGCQAMGCNLVEKIMPRGAVKPTYIIIALFGLLALILAIYTYKGMYGYSEHFSQYGESDNPQFRDSWNSVSSSAAYASLGGMY